MWKTKLFCFIAEKQKIEIKRCNTGLKIAHTAPNIYMSPAMARVTESSSHFCTCNI